MRSILAKYILPRFGAENESGAAADSSSPAAEAAPGTEGDEGSSSTSSDDGTGSEEGAEKTQNAKPAPSVESPKGEEKKADWKDKKIAKLTARLREAQQKPAAEAAPVAPAPGDAPAAPLQPTDQFNKMVQQEAAKQRAAEEFSKKCDAEAAAGKALYGDKEFNDRLAALQTLIDQNSPEEATNYFRFINAALETGKAKDIIFQLGEDLDQADRILGMNDVKMGVTLARMADSIEAPTPEAVTGAPKPITTVGGRSGDRNPIDPTDGARADQLSTAEWMKRRNAQVDARKAR